MGFIIFLVVIVAICVGYFVYTHNMNKKAKYCSCGKKYSQIDGDVLSYTAKKKDETMIGGQMHAIVTVNLKCTQCEKTSSKKIRVIYDPSIGDTVEDGITHFFG